MISPKKKILFYNTDLRGGGAEKILVNIANELSQRGYDITVGTFFEEGINRADLNSAVKQFWTFRKPFRAYSKLALLFSAEFLFRKCIPNENYDLMISFLEGFPSRVISGAPKKQKTLSWIHLELYPNTITKEFRSRKEALESYESFNKIICVAESVKHHFLKCSTIEDDNVQVIYNPLEIIEIEEKALESNPFEQNNYINIVTVGRLNPQKSYDRLLRIVKKLKDDGLQFRLHILGTGPMESELQRYVSSNNLQNIVTFVGFQKNPYPFIKNADLFVCSSLKEGYSTVVTESVILETPVITTACSGMDEILDHGNAGIITTNDENALYLGLKDLILHPEKLISLKEKVKERSAFLKSRNTYDQIERLINEL